MYSKYNIIYCIVLKIAKDSHISVDVNQVLSTFETRAIDSAFLDLKD